MVFKQHLQGDTLEFSLMLPSVVVCLGQNCERAFFRLLPDIFILSCYRVLIVFILQKQLIDHVTSFPISFSSV